VINWGLESALVRSRPQPLLSGTAVNCFAKTFARRCHHRGDAAARPARARRMRRRRAPAGPAVARYAV